jgi:hypothetical protein
MAKRLGEYEIVKMLAHETASRMLRKTIRELMAIPFDVPEEFVELKSVWDCVCAQVRYEHGAQWSAYEVTVRTFVECSVADLHEYERAALWLQSDAGSDWYCESPDKRLEWPVYDGDIVEYIVREYVYDSAGRWSNPQIRAFMRRVDVIG